jgi:crotonobetainyl-CoA:carnitine CoA-transferase CaiB-like acyl-CoA transferase
VIEVGGTLAAAAATRTFSDYGADVVKVEPQGGGETRRLPPFADGGPHVDGGAFHLALDTSKRSIVLDVASPSGLEVLGRLCDGADLLVLQLPLEQAERALAAVEEAGPETVVITPHGRDGPYRDRTENDMSLLAWSSRMHRHAIEGEEPLRYAPHVATLQIAATAAAAGIAAVWAREHGAPPSVIDVAGVEALAGNVDSFFTIWSILGADLPRGAGASHVAYPAGNYRCADGYVLFAASGEPFFSRLCRGIGHPELPTDPRFAEATAKAENWEAFMEYLDPWLGARTRDQVFTELQAHGVMVAPVLDISETLSDAQAVARGSTVTLDRPGAGPVTIPGPPFRMVEGWAARPAPRLGEHTSEILNALGHTPDEQIALFRAGVTG